MTSDPLPQAEPIMVCTPDAVPLELRGRWFELAKRVYAAVQEVEDLPDGYSLRLPNDATMLLLTAEYVSLDRLCCQYVRWSLITEPYRGALLLQITGPEGTKALTRYTFETTTLLREEVASAAGFNVTTRAAWIHPNDPKLVLS